MSSLDFAALLASRVYVTLDLICNSPERAKVFKFDSCKLIKSDPSWPSRMKLRKLSFHAAILLLLAVSNSFPASCFAQSESHTSITTSLSSCSNEANRPSSLCTVSELDKSQLTRLSGSVSCAPNSETMPRSKKRSEQELSRLGIGIKLASLGAGIEAATAVTRRTNLRGGFNAFNYSRGFNKDGITYSPQLSFRSVEAHFDVFPFGGGFHLSPGLLVYNGNQVTANAAVPGGQTFSLGNNTFLSDPADPVTGKGKLDFIKVATSLLMGYGNLVPRTPRHFTYNLEMGVVFEGSPRTSLNLKGTACDLTGTVCRNAATDPTIQSSIQSELVKIKDSLSPLKYYPVISVGLGYKF